MIGEAGCNWGELVGTPSPVALQPVSAGTHLRQTGHFCGATSGSAGHFSQTCGGHFCGATFGSGGHFSQTGLLVMLGEAGCNWGELVGTPSPVALRPVSTGKRLSPQACTKVLKASSSKTYLQMETKLREGHSQKNLDNSFHKHLLLRNDTPKFSEFDLPLQIRILL